jgi:chemotaxis protein histidine kinase CheA
VTALTGAFVVLHADRNDREVIDRALTARVAQVRVAAAKSGTLPTDGSYAVRLLDGTDVRAERGATTKFSIPVKDGFSTVTAEDGSHWRSWAETLKTGAQLQILINLAQAEERHDGNVRMIDLAVLLAALIAGLGTWLVAGLVLRPLIRTAAAQSAPGDPSAPTDQSAAPSPFTTTAASTASSPNGASGVGRGPADAEAAQAVERAAQAVEWATQADALAAQANAKATQADALAAQANAKATQADERAAQAAAKATAADELAAQATAKATEADERATEAEARAKEMTERAERLQAELDRLRQADAGTAATERLAGEVGGLLREPLTSLGAELDQILDSPEMSSIQRHLLLAAIQNEHRRMIELVDELEARSGGEATR